MTSGAMSILQSSAYALKTALTARNYRTRRQLCCTRRRKHNVPDHQRPQSGPSTRADRRAVSGSSVSTFWKPGRQLCARQDLTLKIRRKLSEQPKPEVAIVLSPGHRRTRPLRTAFGSRSRVIRLALLATHARWSRKRRACLVSPRCPRKGRVPQMGQPQLRLQIWSSRWEQTNAVRGLISGLPFLRLLPHG